MTLARNDHEEGGRLVGRLHVGVDRDRCAGHGTCAYFAGAVFALDDLGFNNADDLEVPEELRDEALRGVAACPERAIWTREAETKGGEQ
jgi:ferredoxin